MPTRTNATSCQCIKALIILNPQRSGKFCTGYHDNEVHFALCPLSSRRSFGVCACCQVRFHPGSAMSDKALLEITEKAPCLRHLLLASPSSLRTTGTSSTQGICLAHWNLHPCCRTQHRTCRHDGGPTVDLLSKSWALRLTKISSRVPSVTKMSCLLTLLP
jgi:hypothetical protein